MHHEELPEADDELLISSFRDGSDRAFEKLVIRYQRKIRLYCRYMLGAGREDDAAQEVFIKLLESRQSIDPSRPFLPFVLTIARNVCTDLLRKQSRRKRLRLVVNEVYQRLPLPRIQSQMLEDQDIIRHALRTLPVRQREVVLLKDVCDMSYESIASTMGLSVEAVRGQLKRARQSLITKGQSISSEGSNE